MVRATALIALVAAIGASPVSALAQTEKPALARLTALAEFATEAGWCGKMGFDELPGAPDTYGEAAISEAILGGVSRSEAEGITSKVLNSALARMEAETGRLTGLVSGPPETFRSEAIAFATAKSRACHAMGADPVGKLLIKAPPYTVAKSAQMLSDSILEPAGLASWQTPYIRAGGEMARSIGYCANTLTPQQVAKYRLTLNDPAKIAPDVRQQARSWFDLLQDRGERIGGDLDETQCARVMASSLADLKVAK